ncbi:SPOR domain-containing protein [Neptunomonas sp. XY-337]|uniref:SPOR domain-containing protein n=1 Tax=Neptunomonas sp. XY-337 TaxID=2561897 RepID=UPI00197D0211|nr:SPOR domain-containing protein [Neptunomonas sp. XY-337]
MKDDSDKIKGISPWLKEKELLNWPASAFTLQVLGARSEESVEKFIASLDSRDRLYYFKTVLSGKPWHVVVYGQYASKAAASRAITGLPEELRKLGPWPRSVKGVHQDIQKK